MMLRKRILLAFVGLIAAAGLLFTEMGAGVALRGVAGAAEEVAGAAEEADSAALPLVAAQPIVAGAGAAAAGMATAVVTAVGTAVVTATAAGTATAVMG